MQSRPRSVRELESAAPIGILPGFSFIFTGCRSFKCLSNFVLQSVLVSVFYSKPQRLDVYVDDTLVAPTNAQWNAANTDYTLKKPIYAGTEASLAPTKNHK